MALTKGIGFMNVRDFTCARFGPAGWGGLLDGLSSGERAVLAAVVPVGWYDLTLYSRLIRTLDERLGVGDLRLVYALGRFEAERDLTTIQRVFLQLVRPSIAIEQMNKYWKRFHDTGTWTTERGEREVSARLAGWGVVDAALCRELVGYLGRTLELLGGSDVFMDHRRCRGRGDDQCEFHATWRSARDEVAAPVVAEGSTPSPSSRTPSTPPPPNATLESGRGARDGGSPDKPGLSSTFDPGARPDRAVSS